MGVIRSFLVRDQTKRLTITATKNHDEVALLDARVRRHQRIYVFSEKDLQTFGQFCFTVIYRVHSQVFEVFLYVVRRL